MRRVCVVASDTGTANNVGPVAKELAAAGVEVQVIADDPAKDAFRAMDLAFGEYESAQLLGYAEVNLILGGFDTSNNRPPITEISRYMRVSGKTGRIALVSDLVGAVLAMQGREDVNPVLVCAADDEDAQIIRGVWPDAQVAVTGKPASDAFAEPTPIPENQTREALGIPKGLPVVLFAGQLNRTGEAFRELAEGLIANGREVCVIGRKHPRMLTDEQWADEERHYGEAVDLLGQNGIQYVDCTGPGYNPTALISLTGGPMLVVSMFSTMLEDAARAGVDCLALLSPEVGQSEWDRVAEGIPLFQPVEKSACASAASPEELARVLDDWDSGALQERLALAQQKEYGATGGATCRVTDEILKLLG